MSNYWYTCNLEDFLESIAIEISRMVVEIFVNKYSGKCYGGTFYIETDGKSFEEIETAFKITVEKFVNPKYFTIDTCKFIKENIPKYEIINSTEREYYCVKPFVKIMSNTARKK